MKDKEVKDPDPTAYSRRRERDWSIPGWEDGAGTFHAEGAASASLAVLQDIRARLGTIEQNQRDLIRAIGAKRSKKGAK